MAKLKGMKKVHRIINEFTRKEFGVKAKLDTEFEAWCDENVIGYTLAIEEDDINQFLRDAEKRFPTVKADPFLWLLLHEIGHCMTNEMWTTEELTRFDEQREILGEIVDNFDTVTNIKNDWYHSLPDEYWATRFAGAYMMNKPKKVKKFWKKLQPAIIEFYQLNGLI